MLNNETLSNEPTKLKFEIPEFFSTPEFKARMDAVEQQQEIFLGNYNWSLKYLPKRYKDSPTLDELTPLNEHQITVKNALLEYAKDKPSLYIFGPPGTGKTYLAVSYLLHIAKTYQRSFDFIRMADWVSSKMPNKEELEIDYRHYSLFDDLGSERYTEFAIAEVSSLVDEIYNQIVHVVITSNFSLDSVAQRYGQHTASRIAGHCKIIQLDGNDLRVGRRK